MLLHKFSWLLLTKISLNNLAIWSHLLNPFTIFCVAIFWCHFILSHFASNVYTHHLVCMCTYVYITRCKVPTRLTSILPFVYIDCNFYSVPIILLTKQLTQTNQLKASKMCGSIHNIWDYHWEPFVHMIQHGERCYKTYFAWRKDWHNFTWVIWCCT